MTVILLAAGLSERMGCSKLLLPFRGRPLIISTLSAVLKAESKAIVVTGHEREKIEDAVAGMGIRTVYADEYMKGQRWSTLRGVEAVEDDDFAIIPADLPLISPDDIKGTAALLDRFETARAFHRGTPGHPVVYRRELRDELLRFDGTMKQFLSHHAMGRFEGSLGCTFDADTPESYRMLLDNGTADAANGTGLEG